MQQHVTSALSQIFGRFASKAHAPSVQKVINNGYVKLMGLDMSDFQSPDNYPTLNALFTRKLNQPRTFSLEASALISPCDSLITECGNVEMGQALQIKGMQYGINDFLGKRIDDSSKESMKNGSYINFYLSPKDYHRYHAPLDMQVLKAVHIPGKLYPVNIPTLKKKLNLFIENERVVMECLTHDGKRFFLVLVGALNVGEMELLFEPSIRTNTTDEVSTYTYEDLFLKKGEDFGCFRMGSTIVMIFEEGMCQIEIATGDNVRFGQTIGEIR